MKPTENTIASLLAIESNLWHYQITRFQRDYVWGKYNWSKLLEDIKDKVKLKFVRRYIRESGGRDAVLLLIDKA